MRICLVEDEARLAKSLKRGLEREGFAVDHFANGSEASNHIVMHHDAYDVIVLDLMLPGKSGLDICRTARERSIATPIIVLTAKNTTPDKIVHLNAGVDDYLTKPFSFAELVARVHALMRRPDEALPSELTAGDIRLDPGTHRAFLREVPLDLTTKEFALLEFLMRHPGQALERERILEHVWDFNFNSLSNVVDVHVKNLRKKLGQSDDRVFIETVEGVGYRLVAQV